MTTVWTQEADARLRDYLASHELVAGIGTEESACSVAAINLALTERVTDAIPKCMSKVVGEWMIVVQDAMPSEMRNSPGWKRLLPMAAGTGREREEERLALVMNWMWGTVLPDLQSVADQGGFGAEWRTMCVEKSPEAAKAAAEAAWDAAWDACEGRRDNVPPGRSSAEMWRLKTVPPVAFNQERPNLIEGGLDVQGGDVPASSQGLFRRRDERPRGGPSVRATPGHGAQDARVLRAPRVSTATTGSQTEARSI